MASRTTATPFGVTLHPFGYRPTQINAAGKPSLLRRIYTMPVFYLFNRIKTSLGNDK